VPKFVHPADVNSDGVVDALDTQHWLNAWREYRTHNTTSTPPSEIWKGTVDSNESGVVDESWDPLDSTQPSATNTDWVAFQAQYAAATAPGAIPLDQQLGNLPLYAGYWWDDAIGLYHVRHRVYRPEWGRWLQRDPLGYAPGWNLYQYVNGMPWRSVDPMGLWGWDNDWIETVVDLFIPGPAGDAARDGFVDGAEDGAFQIADSTAQVVTLGGAVPWLDGAKDLHAQAKQMRDEYGWTHSASYAAGYVASGTAIAAGGVLVWQIAGGGTMQVSIGTATSGGTHVVYGAGGEVVHGVTVASMGGTGVYITGWGASTALGSTWFTVTGIPVASQTAVVTGGTASSCLWAAIRGFFRGWGF
jgi:RHS repeat-associated protein